jgi:hypothetical protein
MWITPMSVKVTAAPVAEMRLALNLHQLSGVKCGSSFPSMQQIGTVV